MGNPGEVEGGEEQEKGDQKRFPLSSTSLSKLYDFFLRAIAPFTGDNHVYKNVEAQITLKFENVVVILLVAMSFWGANQN